MSKLLILESPGKIKKIAAILGDGWVVAASMGHVRDLPEKEIGVAAPDFRPNYEVTERGKSIVARLKKLASESDQVYLATDPDREGEAISWHLAQALNLKSPLRVTFNEITPGAVNGAVAQPKQINTRLVAAQEARRVLDRLVGYMVSPVLSNKAGQHLSAGRVQSPAVRLVVDRERAIAGFKPRAHYVVEMAFGDACSGVWRATWDFGSLLPTDTDKLWLDGASAERVTTLRRFRVLSCEDKEQRQGPPAPFITSTLQQAASVALNLTPKMTMGFAQRLYEQGAISYHRTDNPNLSDEAFTAIQQWAATSHYSGDVVAAKRSWKAKEGAQEAQEAIRPTHFEDEDAGETADEKRLYSLIRQRAIASQLQDALYAVRDARLIALDDLAGLAPAGDLWFRATGRTITYPGWRKLMAADPAEEEQDGEAPNPVPALMLIGDQALTADSGAVQAKRTKPPARYSEAGLIKKLEGEGIGRPATYAAIMENIINRGYVAKERKILVPTETGNLVVDALTPAFSFIDLGFTRDMEASLDGIAGGTLKYSAVVTAAHARLTAELEQLHVLAPAHTCALCQKALRRIQGTKGAFWGRTGYPDCKTSLPDDKGKPEANEPESSFKCPQCQKPLRRRQKRGKDGYDFWGCTGFPTCRSKYDNERGKPQF